MIFNFTEGAKPCAPTKISFVSSIWQNGMSIAERLSIAERPPALRNLNLRLNLTGARGGLGRE